LKRLYFNFLRSEDSDDTELTEDILLPKIRNKGLLTIGTTRQKRQAVTLIPVAKLFDSKYKCIYNEAI
jgi:poly(A) polymerase Pap1